MLSHAWAVNRGEQLVLTPISRTLEQPSRASKNFAVNAFVRQFPSPGICLATVETAHTTLSSVETGSREAANRGYGFEERRRRVLREKQRSAILKKNDMITARTKSLRSRMDSEINLQRIFIGKTDQSCVGKLIEECGQIVE
jgi:hypothetical protein